MSQFWRLIPSLAASGETQMAIDRWLLQQHSLGKHPSTLRFYTWSQPTISLGYHQRHYPEFWNELGVKIVKRPTGGRAVLHQGDLTYAVVTADFVGRRMDVYAAICEFLIQGWRSLGIELHYGKAGRGYIHNPNCFATATGADLVTTDGYKLIGSAQVRKGETTLQHGSMRLYSHAELFSQVFETPASRCSLPASLQTETAIPRIVQALTQAACECFGIELVRQPLTQAEWEEIYANPALR